MPENCLMHWKQKGAKYLFTQLPIDFIYPRLFVICYSLLFAFFLKKIGQLDSKLFPICWLPVIAGLSDYLENLGFIQLLTSYPDISASVVSISNIFTLIKSGATTLFFIALLILFLVFVVKVIQGDLVKD